MSVFEPSLLANASLGSECHAAAVPAARLSIKPYVLCLSLANLFFVKPWTALYRIRVEEPTAVAGRAFSALLEATVIDVLILAVLFGALYSVAQRIQRPNFRTAGFCVFLVACTFPLERLCWLAFDQLRASVPIPLLQALWGLLLAIPLLGCVMVAVYGKPAIVKGAVAILTVASPLFALSTGSMLWSVWTSNPAPAPALAALTPGIPEHRLVWIIFDELDYGLAFEHRPPRSSFPELDKLRAESLYATDASSPASDTEESMPALLTGKIGTAAGDLFHTRTVFADIRERGFNVAAAGWYMPYCTAMVRDLVECTQPTSDVFMPLSVLTDMHQQWSDRIKQNWIANRFTKSGQNRAPWFGFAERQQQMLGFVYMRSRALRAVGDRRYGFVFLHFPIPHPLGIYRRETGEIIADPESDYIDNLALADRTLGELRRAIADANLAGKTDLIVSSDHPLRVNQWIQSQVWDQEEAAATGNRSGTRVPFLVDLAVDPGQVEYAKPMNTIVTKDLAAAILDGSVRDQAGVARWLDAGAHSTGVMARTSARERP